VSLELAEIEALEAAWQGRVAVTEPETYFGWEPCPPRQFLDLLRACLPHVPPGRRTFIDAGCGIGTKLLLAQQEGLAAHGIDRVPEFVAEARRLGASADLGLIEDYTGFGRFGLVYYNHPLACGPGCDFEAGLEHHIHRQVPPGSVVIGMNYDLAPGCRRHPPDRPCDDDCPYELAGWAEVARLGPWAAAWVKL
jgi:SAM-dependent methyltransferase